MPLQATSGAASYDGFGGGVPFTPTYIEDVFSTWLYTGNGSTQTITNGIDLSTNGGLVWIKNRISGVSHGLYDTNRGAYKWLASDRTDVETTQLQHLTSFNNNGFSLGSSSIVNGSIGGATYASWTFRKQPKFFDVVTYTGNGTGPRAIPHSLGSTPGVAILKKTSTTSDWIVTDPGGAWGFYGAQPLYLNNTNAKEGFNQTGVFSADATSIYVGANTFSTGTNFGSNDSGVTYVAYLFAHNAGGFGLTGTDNVITCGSFVTSNTSGFVNVQLGWEPQWILFKKTTSGGANETINDDWFIADNMRGLGNSSSDVRGLHPNLSAAEGSQGWTPIRITATGFQANTSIDQQDTFVYIAIRRGPMRTPTTGTSVYNAIARTGTSATATVTGVGFPPDLAVIKDRIGTTGANWLDRLRGPNLSLRSNNSGAEVAAPDVLSSYDQNGVTLGSDTNGVLGTNTSGNAMINWFFRRAPGFFDEVCYTGTGSYPFTINHNLGVAPELMIFKRRDTSQAWWVYAAPVTSPNANWYQNYATLNSANQFQSDTSSFTTAPTATAITTASFFSPSGGANVVYLFASCPGVSKVGSYTGNGSSQTINCGFTGGARWVLIKRTDSAGDWYVWDSTRGIVAGNDPLIRIGVGAAEDTTDDSIDTNSTGFIVNQVSATNINISSASYIFLAIA